MGEKDFRSIAINAILDYYNQPRGYNTVQIKQEDVYVVWECKTLQNNKAMLSTTVPDGKYYEFTWNGDKQEGYLDVYNKETNILIKFNKI